MHSRIEVTLTQWATRVTATRRRGLGAALAALLTRARTGGADATGNPAPEGPCGDGTGPVNRCRKNRQCCTGICDRSRKRCRCLPAGASCTESRNCCVRNGAPLTCSQGVCAVPPSNGWSNQTTFGSTGAGPDNFFDPYGVTVSPSQTTAWVADFLNNRVSVWTRPDSKSTAWSNQTTFGVKGSGLGELHGPARVAVSSDTLTCWVTDYANDRVSVWTRPDAGSATWTNQTTFGVRGSGPNDFRRPVGVAVSGDQLMVWIADSENNRVSIWTRPDAASTAWVNQTTFGAIGSNATEFVTPVGLTVSADGLSVWVADYGNNRISVWARPDSTSTSWANATTFGSGPGDDPGSFFGPLDVAVVPDTLTLWIADEGNQRISVWTRPDAASNAWANLTIIGSLGSAANQFAEPSGIAVSANGRTLWVADYGNNRISVWRYR